MTIDHATSKGSKTPKQSHKNPTCREKKSESKPRNVDDTPTKPRNIDGATPDRASILPHAKTTLNDQMTIDHTASKGSKTPKCLTKTQPCRKKIRMDSGAYPTTK